MARLLTQAAQAAKEIRQILKKKGIPARVTSKNFSMGSSVTVNIEDQPPHVKRMLEKELDCYEYGTFDSMTDSSGVKNRDFDGPQAKYLHINNHHSDALKQAAWTFIRARAAGADEFPEQYKEIPGHARFHDEWLTSFVYQVLTGYREELGREFWATRCPEPDQKTGDQEPVQETTPAADPEPEPTPAAKYIIRDGKRPEFSEVVFDSIPSEAIRDSLKNAGFRWSRRNRCWYGKTENLPDLDTASQTKENPTDPPPDPDTTPPTGPQPRPAKKKNHADKLRTIADNMAGTIENKLADRMTNTPKRLAQANHARLEGERLQRTQKALYALADLHEVGSVPPILERFTNKKSVYELMNTKKKMVPNGWHAYQACTGEPASDSPEAVALWNLIDRKSQEEKEADKLRRDLEGLQFSKIPGYFPTPENIAGKMVGLAALFDGCSVMEPEAGSGAIIKQINGHQGRRVAVEYNSTLKSILERSCPGWEIHGGDFLTDCTPDDFGIFDRVIMNPPFNRGDDIKHIKHALEFLRPGGRLVALCANGPRQKKELQGMATHWEELPEGSFKQAGTGVNVALMVIDK